MPDSKDYDTQMAMHYATNNSNVSLYQVFKKQLNNLSCKNGAIDQGKYRKCVICPMLLVV